MLRKFQKAFAVTAVAVMVMRIVPALAADFSGLGQAALEWGRRQTA